MQKMSKLLPTGADVVIVGGGMSGLSVASEMARRSRASVVVLEAGPDAGRAHIGQAADEDGALQLKHTPQSDPYFWRPYDTEGPHYLGLAGLRRRVGGRSLYWGGALLPIEDWALKTSWPTPVAADLVDTWDGGASLYARVASDVAEWVGSASLRSPNALVMADTAFQPTPHAVRVANGKWSAYSPIEAFDDDSKVPLIVPDCHVVGVLTVGGRVSGIRLRYGGRDTDIATKHVVLAGGTIENSRLAIQTLTDVGALESPHLTGLVDKIAQGFSFCCPANQVHPSLLSAAKFGTTFHRPLGATMRSNHFVRLWTRRDGAIALDTWLMGEQERSDFSLVNCLPEERPPWATRVTATLTVEDRMLCTAQRELLITFWQEIRELFSAPATAIDFDQAFGSPDLSARLLSTHQGSPTSKPLSYSFPLGSEQHEAGTIPLGTLLDDAHEFKSVSGMRATGPSTFPRTGAANPAMTILALGRRLAGKLARD